MSNPSDVPFEIPATSTVEVVSKRYIIDVKAVLVVAVLTAAASAGAVYYMKWKDKQKAAKTEGEVQATTNDEATPASDKKSKV